MPSSCPQHSWRRTFDYVDRKWLGPLAGAVALDHFSVRGFEVTREPRGIEERMGLTIAREPFRNLVEQSRIAGKLKRACLVLLKRMRHHVGEANRMQQA